MATSKPAVSFLGLGAMGFGMATNLLQTGHAVTGFDVWPPTLEKFTAAGGSTANTPADAVRTAPYCIVMVATAQQAQSVLFEGAHPAAPALPQNTTLLLCSTVPCAYVQGLAKALAAAGRADVLLVDSPVSGGTIRAGDGTLSIMAGGSAAALESARGLLEAMADPLKLYIVEGGVGAGSNMKMCHQVLAANQILSASEALGFAAHLGLDLKRASEAILASEGRSWMFENRLPRLLAGPEFKPVASAVTIILKDAGIITSEARRYGFASPMTSVAEQVFLAALGRGWGADDDASVLRVYSEGCGKVGAVKGLAVSEQEKIELVVDLLKGIHLCSAAETIAFANHVGLDLDQVFNLCINAAGGSAMLDTFGPHMIQAFKVSKSAVAEGWTTEEDKSKIGLHVFSEKLQKVVDEAQRLKTPLFLGNQALTMIRLASASNAKELAAAAVVKAWVV